MPPTHWTYRECKATDGLHQGDIIAREPLLDVLNRVHKHFTDPKYLAFIVLTQTCDLVVRKKVCKAKHIGLAVIRPLAALMPTVLEEMCQSPCPGIFTRDRRKDAEEFLRRVLNQNEQANGWVYLHPDADAGIGEPAVAMLRIGISLRAPEHYETILKARCGSLDTEYRNKLGWLTGNLYARIDTTDWGDRDNGVRDETAIINDLLDGQTGPTPPAWLPAEWIAAAKKNVNLKEVPAEKVEAVIRGHAPKPPMEVALGEVRRVVTQMRVEFTNQPVAAFQAAVDSDPAIMALLHGPAAEAVRVALGEKFDDRLWGLMDSFATDGALRGYVTTNLKETTGAFLRRRGERKLPLFSEWLAERLPFTGNALARAAFLAEEIYAGDYLLKSTEAMASLAALKYPQPLVAHLVTVAANSVSEAMAELAAGRLTNSPAFKGALKPE